jgi:hypothetical protein
MAVMLVAWFRSRPVADDLDQLLPTCEYADQSDFSMDGLLVAAVLTVGVIALYLSLV